MVKKKITCVYKKVGITFESTYYNILISHIIEIENKTQWEHQQRRLHLLSY